MHNRQFKHSNFVESRAKMTDILPKECMFVCLLHKDYRRFLLSTPKESWRPPETLCLHISKYNFKSNISSVKGVHLICFGEIIKKR